MGWAHRPASDMPEMVQRTLRDARGRTWIGSVSSGTDRGGEEHAEVIFVCQDQPGELKRVSRLDVPPAQADDAWRAMDDAGLQEVFRRSEPA